MSECECKPAKQPNMAWDELAARAVINVLLDVCLKHQVWPAELLNWRLYHGGKLPQARRELCRALKRDLRYTPAQNKRPAIVSRFGCERELSYPILAALCGAACHQGIMRALRENG